MAHAVCGDGVQLAGLHSDKPDGAAAGGATGPVGDHVQELDDVCPQLAGGQRARHHATTSSTTAIGRGLTGPLKGTSRRVRFPELM